jgi:hypothetical protein
MHITSGAALAALRMANSHARKLPTFGGVSPNANLFLLAPPKLIRGAWERVQQFARGGGFSAHFERQSDFAQVSSVGRSGRERC